MLFVCLGNICRSPTVEGVFRHLAALEAAPLGIAADSAGTSRYHIGARPDPRSVHAARRRGVDLSSLRARQVVAADFSRFDLILAMDHANLRELQALRPKGATAQIRLFLEYAPHTGVLEVPDPYQGAEQDFETVLDLAFTGSSGLLQTLRTLHQVP